MIYICCRVLIPQNIMLPLPSTYTKKLMIILLVSIHTTNLHFEKHRPKSPDQSPIKCV